MKFSITPSRENSNHNILYKSFKLVLAPSTVALEITVFTVGDVWCSYILYDGNGNIRGEYIGTSTPQPVIVTENAQFSPNTISGSFGSAPWCLEVCGIMKENTSLEKIKIEIEVTEKDKDQLKNLEESLHTENPWYSIEQGVFELTYENPQNTKEETKWYRGDFHTHTIYSDGKMSREENLIQAEKMGLDFFTATDHNIVPTSWPPSTEVLVIPGVEITSPHGHYNQIGVRSSPFQDKGFLLLQSTESLAESFEKKETQHHLNSINHPFLGEWKWLAGETNLNQVDAIEIWNDPTYHSNPDATEKALLAWDQVLSDGYKITGIGGSDSHLRPEDRYSEAELPSLIGDPSTYVFSEKLDIPSIISHVKAGNVWVSRFDCKIDFSVDGQIAGSRLPYQDQVTAFAKVTGIDACTIEWIINGEIKDIEKASESQRSFEFAEDSYYYIRITIRDLEGELIGFTNPVYFGEKQPSLTYWRELVEDL
ncbi:CehA/McbA family metallohydrolase [Enterococcus faecalis]|uniref:CehA/McbA family metallohydrolase n=1 Tax=Enterococcus faecalis TaxID=1351 RepID=UPI004041CC8E